MCRIYSLKGVLPKVYARQNLDPTSLGELIDLIGNIALGDAKSRSADVLGHVFEYFLGEFALAEGKQGGQFYTPKSESDKLAAELNLTEYEYAFYSAVAENESARELMQKEILRELAIVITNSIRQNVTLDWTIKESARAKLRVIVKRLLKKYGYPPDMALLATETVLEQAEQLADELSAA